MLLISISEAIRELRRAYGESQQYFATRLKISISSLANYEIGTRRPDTAALLKLYGAAEDLNLTARDPLTNLEGKLSDVFARAVRESAGGQVEPIRNEAERIRLRVLRFILNDPRGEHLRQRLVDLLEAGEALMTSAEPEKIKERKKK
jgi:transcriptional regulator with XRE-family HTH domain